MTNGSGVAGRGGCCLNITITMHLLRDLLLPNVLTDQLVYLPGGAGGTRVLASWVMTISPGGGGVGGRRYLTA